MGVKFLSDVFDIGADILTTVLDAATNVIMAQTGNVVTSESRSDNAEVWQHVGFASRPSPPTGGKAACQAIAIRHSERDCIIATRDTRASAIYGNLKDGETCLFATGADGKGQARVMLKQDGAVTLYTTDTNANPGSAVYLRVAPDALQFVAPWGTLRFDASGFHVITAAGPRLDMGSSMPGMPMGLGAYATISAPVVSCKGSVVKLGAGPAYQYAVVSPIPLAPILSPIGPTNALPSNGVMVTYP